MNVAPLAAPGGGERRAVVVPLPSLAPTFEAFFRAHHGRTVALVAALCGRAAAEDIAQEAFVRAHRSWATVASYDRPEAWVRRVAVNLAISTHRRSRRESVALGRLAGRPTAVAADPSSDSSWLGDDEALWTAVRSLPRRQAAAVALRYVDDLSVAEIATTLGCAEGTAKALLHQGRSALAARLGEPDHDDGGNQGGNQDAGSDDEGDGR